MCNTVKVEKAARGSRLGKERTGRSNVAVGSSEREEEDGLLEGEEGAAGEDETSCATVWHRKVQTASWIGTINRKGGSASLVPVVAAKVSTRRCVGGIA